MPFPVLMWFRSTVLVLLGAAGTENGNVHMPNSEQMESKWMRHGLDEVTLKESNGEFGLLNYLTPLSIITARWNYSKSVSLSSTKSLPTAYCVIFKNSKLNNGFGGSLVVATESGQTNCVTQSRLIRHHDRHIIIW